MILPQPTDEYKNLNSIGDVWGNVYGPIQSRRLGLSLGINLLGDHQKICSYNCAYCELGTSELRMTQIRREVSFPSIEDIAQPFEEKLKELISSGAPLDYISIAGNGEATLHPYFPEAVEKIIQVRNEIASQTKIALFTNGTGLDNRKILNAANSLDHVMVKFDCGNDELLKKMNSPLVRMNISKLIENIKNLKKFTIQSCFIQGVINNTTEDQVADWIEAVTMTRPKTVHIYTLDRIPAIGGLIKVDDDTLDIIAQKLRKKSGANVLAFS